MSRKKMLWRYPYGSLVLLVAIVWDSLLAGREVEQARYGHAAEAAGIAIVAAGMLAHTLIQLWTFMATAEERLLRIAARIREEKRV